MKIFGADIIKINKGFFGIRKCETCGELKNVNLLILKGVVRFFFFPIKTLITKKFLVCQKCEACYEITEDQWNYYSTYISNRLDQKTTEKVVQTLNDINKTFLNKGTIIDIDNEIYYPSLDNILISLAKKYGHEQSLQEIMSVYFSDVKKSKELENSIEQ